jgi:ApaG protein
MEKNTDITVDVEAQYMPSESNPDKSKYLFSYTITIKNQGIVAARLLSRYWKITSKDGKVQEMRGDGVVGKHPHIQPEDEFVYTSAAILDTPVGMMQGAYMMIADGGERFDVSIPAFTLAMPNTLH